MTRSILLAAPIFALLASTSLAAQAPADSAQAAARGTEEAAVRATLQRYLNGHATGRGEEFAAAMHGEMRLMSVREGKLSQRTAAEYVALWTGRPAPDEARRRRWIESVDVTGSAAQAKIVLEHPTARLTDYMNLLKVDGEWKIVNKIVHAEPRQ